MEGKMAKKKRRYKKSKKTASKLDLAVVIIMMVSLLLAVLIYTNSAANLNEPFLRLRRKSDSFNDVGIRFRDGVNIFEGLHFSLYFQ